MDWRQPGHDHDAWFFGRGSAFPRWTGYAMGWSLVADYHARTRDARAGTLWDAPATDFLPSAPAAVGW